MPGSTSKALHASKPSPMARSDARGPERGTRVARIRSVVVLLAFVLLSVGAGATVGMLFPPGAWFEALAKPTWNPPSWLFGPVWTTLYALIGLSAWLVWRERRVAPSDRRIAWGLFGLQAVLNLAWTPLFFGLREPGLAFLDISLLWLSVLWMTLGFGRIRPLAGYLMIPYVLWVSFALVLNGTIWLMNT